MKNRLPTLLLGSSGLMISAVAIFLLIASDPWRSQVYVVNESKLPGRIELDGVSFPVAAGEWETISFRTPAESYSAKGFIGDSMVFDTVMGEGAYMSLLGGDKFLLVEEWVYSSKDVSGEELVYELLEVPGIVRFSEKTSPEVYDFSEDAPPIIEVDNALSTVHAFDLRILNQEQLMSEYYEEIMRKGLDYDSLMEDLTVVPPQIDSTIIDNIEDAGEEE
jgi:hypothetical protein